MNIENIRNYLKFKNENFKKNAIKAGGAALLTGLLLGGMAGCMKADPIPPEPLPHPSDPFLRDQYTQEQFEYTYSNQNFDNEELTK